LYVVVTRGRRGEEHEDGELADWLADGYAPAFRTAYLILHNRADAEEAVQEAFLRAWRFRSAIPAGDGVRPWLYRVVVNACLSRLRSDQVRAGPGVTDATLAPDESPAAAFVPSPEAAVLEHETQKLVLDSLAGLPEHLRVVVVLRYYSQLSEREIATVIQRRNGTVKSRLHEARLRLSADPRLAAYADQTFAGTRSAVGDD
jgi:RNA polymerase sigma-70 factor (ECF subfamily)